MDTRRAMARAETSRRTARRGFTLLEVVVAATLFAVVSALAVITFQTAVNSRNVARARVDVYEKARTVLEIMSDDVRAAFLTPESITATGFDLGGVADKLEAPKFVVIDRYVPAQFYRGVDNDGDGQTDEDPIDNIDNDNDGLIDEDPDDSILDRFSTDLDGDGNIELYLDGVDNDNDGLTDEDFQFIPRDLLVFTSAQANPGHYDLVQAGYTLGKSLSTAGNSLTADVAELRRLYHWAETQQGLDFPIPIAGNETDYMLDMMLSSRGFTEKDTVAFDVLGFDVAVFFFDYEVNRWRELPRDRPLYDGTMLIDDNTLWNSALERYPNEPADRIVAPLAPGELAPRYRETDGLPVAVELTVYVVDQEVSLTPRKVTQRVHLPLAVSAGS